MKLLCTCILFYTLLCIENCSVENLTQTIQSIISSACGCKWIIYLSGKKTTPGRGNKTPSGADRFIPSRSSTQFDLGHHLLAQASAAKASNSADEEMMSPSQREYRKAMNENLNGEKMESKIISYKNRPPSAPEGKNRRIEGKIGDLSILRLHMVMKKLLCSQCIRS